MGDEYDVSPDDVLEETRSIRASDMDEQGQVPEENDRPAAPADSGRGRLPIDHPVLDTDVDETEIYHDGIDNITELPHDADSGAGL